MPGRAGQPVASHFPSAFPCRSYYFIQYIIGYLIARIFNCYSIAILSQLLFQLRTRGTARFRRPRPRFPVMVLDILGPFFYTSRRIREPVRASLAHLFRDEDERESSSRWRRHGPAPYGRAIRATDVALRLDNENDSVAG